MKTRDIENGWPRPNCLRADDFRTDILLDKGDECRTSYGANHAFARSFPVAKFQTTCQYAARRQYRFRFQFAANRNELPYWHETVPKWMWRRTGIVEREVALAGFVFYAGLVCAVVGAIVAYRTVFGA